MYIYVCVCVCVCGGMHFIFFVGGIFKNLEMFYISYVFVVDQ